MKEQKWACGLLGAGALVVVFWLPYWVMHVQLDPKKGPENWQLVRLTEVAIIAGAAIAISSIVALRSMAIAEAKVAQAFQARAEQVTEALLRAMRTAPQVQSSQSPRELGEKVEAQRSNVEALQDAAKTATETG
ncbi:MAG TPA: hypothetical protein VHL80_05675 [Polyangia bacterium]|nr:hypothetical protein [Polyangia bacterium]